MKFNTLVKTVAAFAVLATLAPAGASAAVTADNTVAKAEAKPEAATDRILVKFNKGADAKAVSAKKGASVGKALGKSDWKVVNVPAGKAAEFLAKFQGDADVAAADFDYIMQANLVPNDPSYASQYHLPKISAPQAWDITTGSSTKTIAIVDTGVDLDHPDLAAKIVAGYDFVNTDAVADDDQGHGTHCAGIAAAISNNGNQVAGVDFNAKIMPVKVLNKRGSGYTSDIIDGVYFAADNGAHVISMSLGGGSATTAFQDAINYAYGKGAIIVAAAGNSSTSTKSYPAAYNNVVAVASTTSTDAMSSFSNFGSWVDVAAPGSSILSTAMGGGTTTMSGTSMATPVVAGLMSLTWSKRTTATNQAVIDRVQATADKIAGTGTNWVHGRVNAYSAVNGF
jgi:thermitase